MREEFDFSFNPQKSDADNHRSYRVTKTDTTNLEYIGRNIGPFSEMKANAYVMEMSKDQEMKPGMKLKQKYSEIETRGANINVDLPIANKHLMKFGINYRHQEGIQPEKLEGVANQQKQDLGFYGEGIWGFGPVTLTTGLRFDAFKFKAMDGKEVSDGRFNPSLGLIVEATKDLHFNANWNFASRSPRLREVQAATGKDIFSSASDLKAEHSENIELGFNYDLTDTFSLNGSYFWQSIDDLQNFQSTKNNECSGIGSPNASGKHDRYSCLIYNSGKLKNQGYELGAAFKYGSLKLRAGVAYSKPKLNGTTYDKTTTSIPMGRTWTTAASYKFEQPNLEIGWKGRFVEGAGFEDSNRGSGGGKRAGYGVHDLYASWQANDNLIINLGINNLFDKNYKSHAQRTGINSLPGKGRDFRLGVNYTF